MMEEHPPSRNLHSRCLTQKWALNYFDSEVKPAAFPVFGSDRHRVESYDRIDAESLKGIYSARRVKPHAPMILVDSRSEYGLQVLCMITGEEKSVAI